MKGENFSREETICGNTVFNNRENVTRKVLPVIFHITKIQTILRWRNDFTRCCSVYCRTENPDSIPGLKFVVEFICKCYAPMVMDIYFQPQFINGSVHIFNYMKRAKACLSEPHFDFIKQYFLINGGYFHPENMQVAGLLSPHSTPNIRKRAEKMILKSRQIHANRDNVRRYVFPNGDQVNWNARSWFDFLRWRTLLADYVTPPPVLSIYTPDELKEHDSIILPDFKCHSQDCENKMKDIEESVLTNVGIKKQKESIVCTKESRSQHNYRTFRKDEFQ